MKKEKVIVVLPAYNAAQTLEKTLEDIPRSCVDEFILVDDASKDNTVEIARRLGATVVIHPENRGYGANQKTCYQMALQRGADYVVMIHPDYQYDGRLVSTALDILKLGVCDVVLGNRIRTRRECLSSGMPLYKYLANRFLTIVENCALGQNLGEFHSGFRAYRRTVLETVAFERNADGFVFDSQFLMQAVFFGFTLGDIPIPVRYSKESSSIGFRQGVVYGLKTLHFLLVFHLQRLKVMDSLLFHPRMNDGSC